MSNDDATIDTTKPFTIRIRSRPGPDWEGAKRWQEEIQRCLNEACHNPPPGSTVSGQSERTADSGQDRHQT